MRCVNHPDVEVKSFCQSCGKALCVDCVKTTPGGQILCESCATGWQAFQQPFVAPPAGIPNPTTAAFLGLIPGVGAMYNGQLFKGLIHVVVFAVLVSIADNYKIFIMFVFAWVLYQSFEAFHTAKARRDGLPIGCASNRQCTRSNASAASSTCIRLDRTGAGVELGRNELARARVRLGRASLRRVVWCLKHWLHPKCRAGAAAI